MSPVLLHGDSVVHRSHGDAIGCWNRFSPPIRSVPKRPVPMSVSTRREAGSNYNGTRADKNGTWRVPHESYGCLYQQRKCNGYTRPVRVVNRIPPDESLHRPNRLNPYRRVPRQRHGNFFVDGHIDSPALFHPCHTASVDWSRRTRCTIACTMSHTHGLDG